MKDNPQLQHDDLPIWLALKIKFEGLDASNTPCRFSAIRPRDQDDPHDDAYPEGENNAKRQKTSEHGTYVFRESSSGQANESELGPSTSGNQEQLDDFDFWTDTYATDDDELPAEKVSQELVEEMSQIVYEAKLRKVNDIVWESRKEILVSPLPQKPTPVVQSCQRDPKAPALSLINQDLLYLKKGKLGSEKFMFSLHKFPAVIFYDDDIEERTSRWVDTCVKKFNPYARYSVEHWKNPHAKIFYIKRQKEPGKPIKEVYSNSKTLQVNLTIPTITFPGIEKYKMFSIISEPVYGIIYKNSKKEKRVMRHQEIHKFCDATLNRVLEGLKSYNNDVKHGYVTPSLNKEDTEYL
ncbi:hypothetical protein Tco_0559588 [Tanacetum coccineum]